MGINVYAFRNSALRLALLTGVGAIALGQSAQGQTNVPPQAIETGGIGDIVVTARRTEESAQRTPIAITALSSADLQQRQITDIKGVQYSAPNIHIATSPGDPASNIGRDACRENGV